MAERAADPTPLPSRRPSPIDRAFLTDRPDVGRLILVRHGQQQWPDPATAVRGDWVDPPLSELGQRQAECVAEFLAGEEVEAIYSSQLIRANQTAQAITRHHGIDVEVIDELQEIHLYRDLPPDRRPIEELGEKALLGIAERFVQTRKWDAYPHTEYSDEFRRRVSRAVESAIIGHPGKTVVVACHGGVINAYLAEVLGLTPDMFFRPKHASVHRVAFGEGRRIIEVLNEYHYLAAAGLVTS